MPIHPSLAPSARRARPWRARLLPGVLAAALAAPQAAHPYTLDALLRMPLERLLQLEVTPRRAALTAAPQVALAQGSHVERRAHA